MKLCIKCGNTLGDFRTPCPSCLHCIQEIDGYPAFAPELAEDSEGFEAAHFPTLANLEAGNFWFRSRNRLLVWALGQYFPNATSLLEIGCGTGYVLSGIRTAFPELKLSGSEIFSVGLAFAGERLPEVQLYQMDARRIPFREEFDVVGAFDVLEHVTEDEEVLSRMHQATRKGGGILVTVPHHPFLWSALDVCSRHVRRYQTQELRDKIERAGFTVLRITSFVSLLFPALLVSRLKLRQSAREPAASDVRVSPLLNATFERILDLERTIIRAGLSFPAGGSLLAIACRN